MSFVSAQSEQQSEDAALISISPEPDNVVQSLQNCNDYEQTERWYHTRVTNNVHDYCANLQCEEQQLNLLGDIDVNAPTPALTPSPRPSAFGLPVSEAVIRKPSGSNIIRDCRHYWNKYEGNRDEMQCELCGDYLSRMVFDCDSRCKIRICLRCRKKNGWAALNRE